MNKNSAEDTAWLSLETSDFLHEASRWPTIMRTIFNLIAFMFIMLGVVGMSTGSDTLVYISGTAMIIIAIKLRGYYADITLIRNELNRRVQEGK